MYRVVKRRHNLRVNQRELLRSILNQIHSDGLSRKWISVYSSPIYDKIGEDDDTEAMMLMRGRFNQRFGHSINLSFQI